MKTLIVFLYSLLLSCLASCPASYNPADIRVGYVVASTSANVDANIRSASTTYLYQLNSSLPSTPQVALSTNMIEGPLRSDQSYFVTATGSQSQISFVININYATSNWHIIKVGFLAETRTDIQAGVIQMSGLTSQQRVFNQPLTRSISDPFIRTFITGFTVNSPNTQILIQLVNVTSAGNTVSLTVRSTGISATWMSYIVYSSSSLRSAYLVSSGSVGLGNFDTNSSLLEAGTTSIFGFSQFTSSSTSYFQIDSRLSSQLLVNSTSSTLSEASIDYLIVQNLPRSYCSSCNSGNIYEQGYCVTICGSDSVPILSQGTQICMICDIEDYLIINPDKTSCVCAIQFYQPQGSSACQACHSSCITCSGPTANNCSSCDSVPSVSTNKVLVNSSCVCLQRFYQDQSNSFFCLACHYSCLTCSGSNSSNCLLCSTNLGRVKSGNTCSCTNGYRDDGSNEKCACINTNANGVCVVNITCERNQINVNNTCQCQTGFFNISGSCTQCQNGFFYNGAVCVVCSNGTVSSDRTRCTCNSGFFNIAGKCGRCPTNEQYSNVSQACNCASGFYRVSGTCQRPPTNMTYNGTGFVCSTGLYNISGRCSVCTGDQVYNQTTRTCACPAGTTLRNGRCQRTQVIPTPNTTRCSSNEYFNGRVCVCNPGLVNISGSCGSCPQSTYFNGLSCVCPQNTFLRENACTSCPQGATYNGNTCICPSGQTYDNSSNICRSTSTNPTTPGGNSVSLNMVGYMRFTGYLVARVSVSYIPPAYLSNNCAACSNLLNVTITGGTSRPVSTAFSFTSPNTINIFFGFNTPVPQPFTASVRVNPTTFYSGYNIANVLSLNVTNAIINAATGG